MPPPQIQRTLSMVLISTENNGEAENYEWVPDPRTLWIEVTDTSLGLSVLANGSAPLPLNTHPLETLADDLNQQNDLQHDDKRLRFDSTEKFTQAANEQLNTSTPDTTPSHILVNPLELLKDETLKNCYDILIGRKFTKEQVDRMVRHSPHSSEILIKMQNATMRPRPLSAHKGSDLLREELVKAICNTKNSDEIDNVIKHFSKLARYCRFLSVKQFSADQLQCIVSIEDKALRNGVLKKIYTTYSTRSDFKCIPQEIRKRLCRAVCSKKTTVDVLKKIDDILNKSISTQTQVRTDVSAGRLSKPTPRLQRVAPKSIS